MTEAELVSRVLEGEPLAVARAITRVERGALGEQDENARNLVRALFASTGRAHIIGVTGAPGTGKSTLVNALAQEYRARAARVAIIAVDPSSPFSGGALLGDRFRMQELSGTGVFIRSMASRGQLGGLSAAVSDAVTVLDAAGFNPIFVETVGAGQGEVEIAKQAHTTLVLEAPGLGDDLQAIKAGILEIADVLVVNKADREGANAAVAALEMNLNLNPVKTGWRPPVLRTVATSGQGVARVADAAERHLTYLVEHGLKTKREAARFDRELRELVSRQLLRGLEERVPPTAWSELVMEITARRRDLYSAVELLMEFAPETGAA